MLEFAHEVGVTEPSAEWALSTRRTEGDMVFVVPEAHFITGFDTEFVAQFLRNHDLTLGSDTMSHTG